MRRALFIALALSFLGLPLAACGGTEEERAERGLAPADEESTPESEKAMKETEAERQQQIVDEMEKKQQEEFDATNAGKAQ